MKQHESARSFLFRALFTALCLMLPLIARSGVVSEAEALQKAKVFLSTRGRATVARGPLRLARKAVKGISGNGAEIADDSKYYIFNVGTGGGFVIVSGDDRTEAILGYSDQGCIDTNDLPDGLRVLLDDYVRQMASLGESKTILRSEGQGSMPASRRAPARKVIAPLIMTHWDQGTPYNNNCPEIDGVKTATGCVATSMAQLMYYHKWPKEACEIIPAYTTSNSLFTLEALEGTTFSWSDMKQSYGKDDTGDAADAVAELMQYCGWSLQMRYGLSANGGSSTFSEAIPSALKTYFGYDGGVRHTYRKNYSYVEWVDLIYSELASRRPVAMGGQSAGGGHSFICDGYDTDDYFHINWGWGGSSDGYYRLSVLQPWEQGIGGSSTLDGFSFGQNAVIGIQPPMDGTQDYCLSLEGLRFGSLDGSLTSKTFTRNAKTEDFTGISLYFILYCYQYGSHAFDYALQMVDNEGATIHTFCCSEDKTLEWNQSIGGTFSGLTIPSTIDEGTYYIKVMSRPHDSTGNIAWQECFDGNRFQLTATISGDNLTIIIPQPTTTRPISATLNVKGNKIVGYDQEIIASVTGGDADYNGGLYLCLNDYVVMGKTVEIPAKQTVDVRFAYTPSETGENKLAIYSSYSRDNNNILIGSGTKIGTTSVTIFANDATNDQELTITPNVTNLTADGKLYGNAMRVTAKVTNMSADKAYIGHVNCSLRKYNSNDDEVGSYYDAKVQTQHFTISANSSTDITFAYDGLDPTKVYRLRFSYLKDGGTTGGPITAPYAMGEGYAIYAADGNVSIHTANEAITEESVAAVDLRAMTNLSDVPASTNPNCVYFVKTNAKVPSALEGKNIVCDGTATTLTLEDGHDFYTPFTFTATNVSYTRTFTLAANGTSGWNTLFLPFDVTSVTCEGFGDVDWFHSGSDTGKNFWLYTFTGDAAGTAYFDFANNLSAYTPYIIAVPDDHFGTDWQMTDKIVTFSGNNVTMGPLTTSSISGNSYKFYGSTVATTLTDIYALNEEGSTFKRAANADVAAFRAWLTSASINTLKMPALRIANGTPATGLGSIGNSHNSSHDDSNNNWYTLDGRHMQQRPAQKGLYIRNGKKIVVR